MRILIIDDDHLLLDLLAVLIPEEHQVRKAEDGFEAFDILENEDTFDLIITDFYLGYGPNGIDIMEKVKELFPKSKIVLMTGHNITMFEDEYSKNFTKIYKKPLLKHQIESLIYDLIPCQQ